MQMPEPFVFEAILATVAPFPTLQAALLAHPNHKDINIHVFQVLASVMRFNPPCASSVLSIITPADILHAVSLHADKPAVVAAACECLLEWSRQPELCVILRDTEGLIASVQGFEASFPTDATICATARDILARLVVATHDGGEPMQDE